VTTVYIENIGVLVSGHPNTAPLGDTTIVIEDGTVASIGEDTPSPDVVIDAGGLDVLPGLVDGHVHPTFGEYTPAQDAIGWLRNYLHGGTTTMVSAGELHVPGLPFDALDPRLVKSLAFTSRATTGRYRPSGVKLHAGTVLLVTGMTESDFDEMAEAGIQHLKFIFYDWDASDEEERLRYGLWAHERGMRVKIHSGGVSRSGSSRVAGHEIVTSARPDIVAHISGGPIPMPDDEIVGVIEDLPDAFIEVCSSMNYRATIVTTDHLAGTGQLDRLTLGTDTPGGTGVIPRGMLRNICYLASVCKLDPVAAIAAATANVARAHAVPGGTVEVGATADLLLLGPIRGSRANDSLEAFTLGDIPGLSAVLVDGEPVIAPRTDQLPPPRTPAQVRRVRNRG
jgi:enamidase